MARKKRFKSDTAKVVERHLKDPNHQITEDEIRNVRVGMTPPTQDEILPSDQRVADRKRSDEDDKTLPGSQAITPWDTLNPE
jgi:hypothetical protein